MDNKIVKELQKEEAIKRMKKLKLLDKVIEEFSKENGKVNYSENGGVLYWLDEKQYKIMKSFEKKHSAVVYHIIRSQTKFGELLSMLYVSDNIEEWEIDRNDISNGHSLVYVENVTDKMCSEFGYISIKPMTGGLVRVS